MVVSPRSKAYRAKAVQASFHAVCLIGWEGPRPAFFGDNRGALPVRAVATTREMTAADRADLESPHVGIIVHEYVMVASAAHAKRLKDALDEVLLGEQEGAQNNALRHRWRDVRGCWDQDGSDVEAMEHSRAIWWGEVLAEAQRLLRPGAREFDIFDSDEAYRRISRMTKEGVN